MFRKDVNMLDGPIFSRMVVYALPLMLSGILQLLYSAADVAVIGQFSSDSGRSLAALSPTGSIVNLIVGLFLGLSVGACVAISHYIGSKNDRDTSETVHTALLTGILLGVIVGVIGFFISTPLLGLMSTPVEVIDLSSLYLKIYFIGIPASMIYNFGAAVLRAKGDTRYPLMVLIISGAVNVVLNLVTVIFLRMDIAGVATATVLSQIVSALMVVIHLCRLKDACRLYPKKLKIHPDKLLRILRIGLPAGIQSVLFSLSNVMIQSSVNILGAPAMSGNTAAANVDGFVYIAQNSVYHTALAFTGQNYGALNMKRIRRIGLISCLMVSGIGLVLGTVAYAFASPLLSIYAPGQTEAIPYGIMRLEILGLTYFLCGIMEVFTGMLRGLGNSVTPMIISLIGACGFRMFWILVMFPMEEFHNMTWLYISYPVSWVLTAAAQFTAYVIVRRNREKNLLRLKT